MLQRQPLGGLDINWVQESKGGGWESWCKSLYTCSLSRSCFTEQHYGRCLWCRHFYKHRLGPWPALCQHTRQSSPRWPESVGSCAHGHGSWLWARPLQPTRQWTSSLSKPFRTKEYSTILSSPASCAKSSGALSSYNSPCRYTISRSDFSLK